MSHIKLAAWWPHFSNLKMETTNSSKTLVNYQTTRRHISDDSTLPNNIYFQWDGEVFMNDTGLGNGNLNLRYALNFELSN
jgi:hypothetical protein